MAYRVLYKASVERDLKSIDKDETSRIMKKIEDDLARDPSRGEPLADDFQGLLKFRIGAFQVVYTKIENGVLVLKIGRRSDAYR